MDDVAGADRVLMAIIGAHPELATRGEIDRLPDELLFPRQLHSHSRAQSGRVLPEFVEHPRAVGPTTREASEDRGQHRVAGDRASTLGEGRRAGLAADRPQVDPDSDHEAGLVAGNELGQDAGELAGGGTVADHEVVGPLRQHGDVADRVGGGTRRGPEGLNDPGRRTRVRGDAHAQQERTAGRVLPRTLKPASALGLVVGDENRRGDVAGASLGHQIEIGRAGHRHVAQRTQPARGRDVRAHGQKAGRGCRTGGVHSTNH